MSPTGFTLWLTGLPCAGKSTIAGIVVDELEGGGLLVETLDGEDARKHLSPDLGFSQADREVHNTRVAQWASELARAGAAVVVSVIAPYERGRARPGRSTSSWASSLSRFTLPHRCRSASAATRRAFTVAAPPKSSRISPAWMLLTRFPGSRVAHRHDRPDTVRKRRPRARAPRHPRPPNCARRELED